LGPTLPISEEIHALKYRQHNESFREAMSRIAGHLQDSDEHYHSFRDILLDMRFLPAGRVQCAVGSARLTSPYNCFVSETIPDSMKGIMNAATRAAETMRLGGGIGYDFSTLRPRGDLIASIDSASSGPVSFMHIFDAVCGTVASAGHRRGAQMGVLRIDHPDIEEFIRCKQNTNRLTNFNISVGVTDEFMACLREGTPFPLRWGGRVYRLVDAKALWAEIMRATWDYAEPGVLFIDTMNKMNNLNYCEVLAATNPCAEQPLPPNGACLLGSFNLVKYLHQEGGIHAEQDDPWSFDHKLFEADIPHVVRAMDNIVDRALYPLPEQEAEAKAKRRMGLGVTGVANALEAMGLPYGSPEFLDELDNILASLANTAYRASAALAKEKGKFPMWQDDPFKPFLENLNDDVLIDIAKYGLRNSHLLSIAPTGTISLTADNISSGIEPVFAYSFDRTLNTPDGVRVETVEDYGLKHFGVKGKTANECSIDDHLGVLLLASKWVDSSVSKTCNVGPEVSFAEFGDLYLRAYEGGTKGCTTFRSMGKRMGVLNVTAPQEGEGAACFYDPTTGTKTCE
jgi:ribonucleoside-diphosphate reductase alpha chain